MEMPFMHAKATFVGSRSTSEIPRYFLYGDDTTNGSWFVNVEPLAKRCSETNWYIAPHSHPHFTQVVFVRSGSGVMMADGQNFSFDSPAVLVVPVHVVHGFQYAKDTDGWVLTLAESFQRKIGERVPEFEAVWSTSRILTLDHSPKSFSKINESLLELDRELDQGDPGAVIAAEAYVSNILVTLLREIGSETPTPAAIRRGHGAIVAQFKDMVEKRYRAGWTMARFAEELNVSPGALRRACMSLTGETPIKLLHDRMIAEAKRNLIYSEMSITQIAFWMGFEDPSYFSRFFTNHTGERPAAFRQSQKYASGGSNGESRKASASA